jgi:glucose-6-phosphate dehydrogenase assembly protein OpcA
MAPPVSAPAIAGTGPDGETRWHVRAATLSDTVSQLSRIWGTLARESLSEEMARAMADDPRIAPSAAEAATGSELRVRTRTSVLTLVVIAPTAETQERALAAVAALASQHPSRAVIVAPGDPDGPSSFDAHIYAACQIPERMTSEVCTEEVLLRLGGELAQHLASTVAPLLIHDLPVVLWWPDDVPFESNVLRELVAGAERLFVDSGAFKGDGVERLTGMARCLRSGVVVHDIAWMRLLLWRELLAGLFDHPLLLPELRSIGGVRVDIARPGTQARLTRAALFIGWIAAMLDWQAVESMQEGEDGVWRGSMRSGKREIPIEFRPVSAAIDGPVRAAGSLVRVELEAGRARSSLRVRVTRQSDHLLATADWNGAQVARRAARLEAFDEMPFLAEALDRSGHDRVFERALDRAVRLMDPDAESQLGRPLRARPTGTARSAATKPQVARPGPGPAAAKAGSTKATTGAKAAAAKATGGARPTKNPTRTARAKAGGTSA